MLSIRQSTNMESNVQVRLLLDNSWEKENTFLTEAYDSLLFCQYKPYQTPLLFPSTHQEQSRPAGLSLPVGCSHSVSPTSLYSDPSLPPLASAGLIRKLQLRHSFLLLVNFHLLLNLRNSITILFHFFLFQGYAPLYKKMLNIPYFIRGIDSTRCWKHSLEMLAHIDRIASWAKKTSPTPLHHQHQPAQWEQGMMDPCSHSVYAKSSECSTEIQTHQTRRHLIQSSTVQFWWTLADCRLFLLFVVEMSGTRWGLLLL